MTANQHKERGRPRPRQRAVLDLVAEEEVAAPDRPEMGDDYGKKRKRRREKKRKRSYSIRTFFSFLFVLFSLNYLSAQNTTTKSLVSFQTT